MPACEWCGAPAVREAVVLRKTSGATVKAPVCDVHDKMIERNRREAARAKEAVAAAKRAAAGNHR